jgi:glycosyltransferase involved in cell wall biosynthesis
MNTPPVSVILTTYNGATRGYLKAAIESVLEQTHSDLELIVVDDGSTDETAKQVQEYQSDRRVRYIHQENKGLAGARNTGIKQAAYEYICFLDDDDLFEPEKLDKQARFLASHGDPKAGMSYTALTLINETGETLDTLFYPAKGNIYESLFYGNTVCGPSSTMIKKEVFNRVGLFKEHLYSCEDYELWLRISKHYHVYSYDEPLVRYRIHQNKMSTNYDKMHFYQAYTLFIALQDAPKEIVDKKNNYYHRFHECCAFQFLGINNFHEFRRHYKFYKVYGTPRLSLRLKYYLSYFPVVFNTLRYLKQRIK